MIDGGQVLRKGSIGGNFGKTRGGDLRSRELAAQRG